MSRLYYDRIIVLEDVERQIGLVAQSPEEKSELWEIVDEMVHHRVLGCILNRLSTKHHQEFLEKFESAPYDESLFDYLKEKIGDNIEELIKQEIGGLAFEILQEIKVYDSKRNK